MSEPARKLNDLIAECDQLIRSGQITQVAVQLKTVNQAQVPRSIKAELAKTYRRAGLIEDGLRLLHPVIRNKLQMENPASPEEVCEYAALLSRNGSLEEALILLETVDPKRAPQALLYHGFCDVLTWDYGSAAVSFENYLKTISDDYAKLITQVNLAASYVGNLDLDKAESLLNETIEKLRASKANRLLGNCLELMGQVHFRRNEFAKARAYLFQAIDIFGLKESYDTLLIHKWLAVMQAIEANSTTPLLQFREEAVRRKHWESVREADLFILTIKFDQRRFDHLVIGTPLPGYRRRVRSQIEATPSSSYLLGSDSGVIIDLSTGHSSVDLNPGKKVHQVLFVLSRDFYIPINVGSLFSALYPDEYFDINSSPNRVRQALRRARLWIQEQDLSAKITHSHGAYRLELGPTLGLRVPSENARIDPTLADIISIFRNHPFKVSEACERLGLSRSTFHRIASQAIDNGQLVRAGIGKATTYKIAS